MEVNEGLISVNVEFVSKDNSCYVGFEVLLGDGLCGLDFVVGGVVGVVVGVVVMVVSY